LATSVVGGQSIPAARISAMHAYRKDTVHRAFCGQLEQLVVSNLAVSITGHEVKTILIGSEKVCRHRPAIVGHCGERDSNGCNQYEQCFHLFTPNAQLSGGIPRTLQRVQSHFVARQPHIFWAQAES